MGSRSIKLNLTSAENERIVEEAERNGLSKRHFAKMVLFKHLNKVED